MACRIFIYFTHQKLIKITERLIVFEIAKYTIGMIMSEMFATGSKRQWMFIVFKSPFILLNRMASGLRAENMGNSICQPAPHIAVVAPRAKYKMLPWNYVCKLQTATLHIFEAVFPISAPFRIMKKWSVAHRIFDSIQPIFGWWSFLASMNFPNFLEKGKNRITSKTINFCGLA